MNPIKVIDSHTGGEPTRIIVQGGPDLGRGPLEQRRDQFQNQFDHFRSAVVNEPRGSDVLVGGLLCQPVNPDATAGIVFFNNAGYLGMCGHGTIGLMATLKHLGKVSSGSHRIETPVGDVVARLEDDGSVSVENVESYRLSEKVSVEVPGEGTFVGDVAWGGNWFFLVENSTEVLEIKNVLRLSGLTLQIMEALDENGITGTDGALIDHIEFFGEPSDPANDSRNFVMCPGGAYDRSPCGTGTSAKLACLAADNKLAPGEVWRQESIIGSVFTGQYRNAGDAGTESGRIIPTINGTANICSEATLILDPDDPFCMGIPQ